MQCWANMSIIYQIIAFSEMFPVPRTVLFSAKRAQVRLRLLSVGLEPKGRKCVLSDFTLKLNRFCSKLNP